MCVGGRVREREEKRVLLYIGDNGRAESGEKENGCFYSVPRLDIQAAK